MSKLTFRPRQLDTTKSMPVYNSIELPDLSEYVAINRSTLQMPTGMEKEEESELHLQQAISAQQAQSTGTQVQENVVIPTPMVLKVDHNRDYETYYPSSYNRPDTHIKVQAALNIEPESPDYDLDADDEKWVDKIKGDIVVNPLDMEAIMDRLEKASIHAVAQLGEVKHLLQAIDDDVIVAVYDYWLDKRHRNNAQPLMHRVLTERRDGGAGVNPFVAFRRRAEKMQTRKNRKNDEESYERILQLSQDLRKAVTLFDMVKRREKTKREIVSLDLGVLEKRFEAGDFNNEVYRDIQSRIRPQFAFSSREEYVRNSLKRKRAEKKQRRRERENRGAGGEDGGASTPDTGLASREWLLQKQEEWHRPVVFPGSTGFQGIEGGRRLGSDDSDLDGRFAFRRSKGCVYHARPSTSKQPTSDAATLCHSATAALPLDSSRVPEITLTTDTTVSQSTPSAFVSNDQEDSSLLADSPNEPTRARKDHIYGRRVIGQGSGISAYSPWPWESGRNHPYLKFSHLNLHSTRRREAAVRYAGLCRARRGRGGRLVFDRLTKSSVETNSLISEISNSSECDFDDLFLTTNSAPNNPSSSRKSRVKIEHPNLPNVALTSKASTMAPRFTGSRDDRPLGLAVSALGSSGFVTGHPLTEVISAGTLTQAASCGLLATTSSIVNTGSRIAPSQDRILSFRPRSPVDARNDVNSLLDPSLPLSLTEESDFEKLTDLWLGKSDAIDPFGGQLLNDCIRGRQRSNNPDSVPRRFVPIALVQESASGGVSESLERKGESLLAGERKEGRRMISCVPINTGVGPEDYKWHCGHLAGKARKRKLRPDPVDELPDPVITIAKPQTYSITTAVLSLNRVSQLVDRNQRNNPSAPTTTNHTGLLGGEQAAQESSAKQIYVHPALSSVGAQLAPNRSQSTAGSRISVRDHGLLGGQLTGYATGSQRSRLSAGGSPGVHGESRPILQPPSVLLLYAKTNGANPAVHNDRDISSSSSISRHSITTSGGKGYRGGVKGVGHAHHRQPATVTVVPAGRRASTPSSGQYSPVESGDGVPERYSDTSDEHGDMGYPLPTPSPSPTLGRMPHMANRSELSEKSSTVPANTLVDANSNKGIVSPLASSVVPPIAISPPDDAAPYSASRLRVGGGSSPHVTSNGEVEVKTSHPRYQQHIRPVR